MATPIGAFNNQLLAFVEDLAETYTEEKDIRVALDALRPSSGQIPNFFTLVS